MIGRIRRQKGSSGKNRLRFKSFFAEILKTLKKIFSNRENRLDGDLSLFNFSIFGKQRIDLRTVENFEKLGNFLRLDSFRADLNNHYNFKDIFCYQPGSKLCVS